MPARAHGNRDAEGGASAAHETRPDGKPGIGARGPEPEEHSSLEPAPGREIVIRPRYTLGTGSGASLPEPGMWLRDWRSRALLAVTGMLVFLLIVVLVIVISTGRDGSGQPGQAASQSPPGSPPPGSPPPGSPPPGAPSSSTRGSPFDAKPTVSASASAGTPAPGNVNTVYVNARLRIPAMTGSDSAGINLSSPPRVSLSYNYDESTGDLVYDPGLDDPPWASGDPIADLGSQAPSYSACRQAIISHPMDTNAQNLFHGHGYCLAVSQGEIAYVRITSISPGDGTNSGPVTLTTTLWQSENG